MEGQRARTGGWLSGRIAFELGSAELRFSRWATAVFTWLAAWDDSALGLGGRVCVSEGTCRTASLALDAGPPILRSV